MNGTSIHWFISATCLVACTDAKVDISIVQAEKLAEEPTAQIRSPAASFSRFAIATGACMGVCPVIAFEADSTSGFQYFGGLHARLRGDYRGTMDSETWRSCTHLIQAIEDLGIPDYKPIFDCPEYELVAIRGLDTLRVQGCSTAVGFDVQEKLDSIILLCGRVSVYPTKESPDFLTWTPGPVDRR